jgi:hypothetical protein
MSQTKAMGERSEQWRQFWNSIGGAAIDPHSLKPTGPATIPQKELRTFVDCGSRKFGFG